MGVSATKSTFCKVVELKEGGKLRRLGLAHLDGRGAPEEHRHLLVQVEQVLDETE
jgi:hypothetical protein